MALKLSPLELWVFQSPEAGGKGAPFPFLPSISLSLLNGEMQ